MTSQERDDFAKLQQRVAELERQVKDCHLEARIGRLNVGPEDVVIVFLPEGATQAMADSLLRGCESMRAFPGAPLFFIADYDVRFTVASKKDLEAVPKAPDNGEADHPCFTTGATTDWHGDCEGDGWFRCPECAAFNKRNAP